MSNACLHLEFLAGTSFTCATEEAKQKCKLFDLAYVKFDFNGVKCSVKSTCNTDDLYEQYLDVLGSKDKYKFVVG